MRIFVRTFASLYERINNAPDARIKRHEDQKGRKSVGNKADDVGAVC
jgi:hypothetical protein